MFFIVIFIFTPIVPINMAQNVELKIFLTFFAYTGWDFMLRQRNILNQKRRQWNFFVLKELIQSQTLPSPDGHEVIFKFLNGNLYFLLQIRILLRKIHLQYLSATFFLIPDGVEILEYKIFGFTGFQKYKISCVNINCVNFNNLNFTQIYCCNRYSLL